MSETEREERGETRAGDPALARALFGELASPDSGHAEPETLLAYHEGELPEAEAEALAEHLACCPECARALLDLAELAAEPPAEDAADFETAAAWRSLRRELPAAEEAPPPTARPAPRAARPAWVPALLAAMALLSAGLSLHVLHLRGSLGRAHEEIASLARPQVDLPILYLDVATRDDLEGTPEVPAGRERFVLILTPPAGDPETTWGVEILGAAEGFAWRAEGLRTSEYGTLRLGLSRRQLPAGPYRVRLFAGGPDPAAEYEIRIR